MALNKDAIHIGPANIWLGVTAPVGSPPGTLMGHTNGVPATGTHVGWTEGEATFLYRSDKTPITGEQAMGPIDFFVSGETSELRFTMQERQALNLKTAFDAYGHDADANRIVQWSGGAQFAPLTQAIFLSSQKRNDPSLYEFLLIYKGINTNGITLRYSRVNKSMMEVVINPIYDTTRAAGDQLFQWVDELT